MKKVISVFLAMIMVVSLCVSAVVITTAESVIEYTFCGTHKDDSGYAEGNLSFTAKTSGTYYLYWANEEKALDGFFEIKSASLSNGEKMTVSFDKQTAIPAGAKKIIASTVSSCENATVATAVGVYTLPTKKVFSHSENEKEYSFSALSDIHIDMQGGGFDTHYVNSVPHFENALTKCKEHNVDFIVSAGDQITNASGATLEWLTYQQIIADSDYTNPIYESIGNHETRFSKYTDCSVTCGLEEFMLATGLDKNAENVESGTPYFEYTQESTGDHFIFMTLEFGTDPSLCDNFSDEQIAWVSGLLEKYDGDGHRIFLVQHSPIYGYGAGDYNPDPAYEGTIRLESEDGKTFKNNVAFKNLVEKYKDVIWLSGHSHVDFCDNLNYSDENGTSCHMFHIPSCANTTRVTTDETGKHVLDRTFYEDTTQGYFTDVYDDAVIFTGTNLFYDKAYPLYTYIVANGDTPTPTPTEPTTETTEPTTETTEPIIYGDVDMNSIVEIVDATLVQRHLAQVITLSEEEQIRAKVDGTSTVNITDATYIQRFLAKLIDKFPVEEMQSRDKEIAQTGATIEDLSKTQEKAKGYLDAYFQYASYNAFLNLKKAYIDYGTLDGTTLSTSQINTANSALSSAIENFDSLHERVCAETVYFSDVNSMGNVRAYSFKESGTYMEPWPGQKATYMATNSMGQNVYAVTLNFSKYKNVIFSDGGSLQTEDIALDGKSGTVYYPENSSSPYTVGKSIYKKMWYEEVVPIKDITIYFTNTQDWSKVNCYYWTDSSLGKWPGDAMEYVRPSSTNKGIYKMTVPENAKVIFNGGSGGPQTVDISDIADGYGFYPSEKDSSGKWKVTQYIYG